MEDLSDYFKRQIMHKKKGETFGATVTTGVKVRVEKMKVHRKDNRQDLLTSRRHIPENMTPVKSPARIGSATTAAVPTKRLEMLAKWKKTKEMLKQQEKEKAKPLFKVTHVPVNVGLPNLENVNKEIKGKPIKSKFAPAGYKFKGPANIKPIKFVEKTRELDPSQYRFKAPAANIKHINFAEKTKAAQNKGEPEEIQRRIVTRSQSKKNVVPEKVLPEAKTPVNKKKAPISRKKTPINKKATTPASSTVKSKTPKKNTVEAQKPADENKLPLKEKNSEPKIIKKTPENKKLTLKKNNSESKIIKKTPETKGVVKIDKENASLVANNLNDTTMMSTDYSIHCPSTSSSSSQDEKTPDKRKGQEPAMYISPFVTVSRGKGSARKEYESRKSKDATAQYSSPKAGAAYFNRLLDSQVSYLQGLCEEWSNYKSSENVPEEASSMIDVAIGQTNLLITKKFVQFRGLIEKCKEVDSETPVTCEDLHGFWDMMHIQVNNLEKRFDNLNNLKANNWQEILPVPKKNVVKKTKKPAKAVKASSSLREAIQAARKKKIQGSPDDTKTEEKDEDSEKTKKTPSKSLLNNVKTTQSARRNSSPGLMMMKIAQYAKGVETPGKSILKTDHSKSVKSHSKTVFFQDQADDLDLKDDVENDLNQSNTSLQNSSTKSNAKTEPRRSTRLSRTKLF